MTQIHWLNPISDSFTNASDWSGGVVPGVTDNVILDAAGVTPYTVTSSTSETVNSIQTAANATLDIIGGPFTASAGTGGGENAGSIVVGYSNTLVVGGIVDNAGSITLAGRQNGSYATSLSAASGGATLTGGGNVSMQGRFSMLTGGG